MVFVDVGLGDGEVAFDHFEGGVAEDALEGIDVAAVADVVDGECVAESVDGGVHDAGTPAEGLEPFVEGVAVEFGPQAGDEEGLVGGCIGPVSCDVFPDNLPSTGGEGDVALFGALSENVDGAVAEVDIVDPDLAEFVGPDTCVQEQEQHGLVAVGVFDPVGKFSVFSAVGLRAL